jgi:hypothetical protein
MAMELWGYRIYKTAAVSFIYLEIEGEVYFDEIL